MKITQRGKLEILWYIAIAVVMVVILMSIRKFTQTAQTKASVRVEDYFKTEVEKTAASFSKEFINTLQTEKTMASFLGVEASMWENEKINLSQSFRENTKAIRTAIVNAKGSGVDSNGSRISIADTDYFQNLEEGRSFYVTEDNGLITLKKAVVIITPYVYTYGELGGYIVAVYDASEFSPENLESAFDKTNFFGVINGDGQCILNYGVKNAAALNTEGMWSGIKRLTGSDAVVDEIDEKSQNDTQLLYVKGSSNSNLYIISPMELDNLRLVICVNSGYYDTLKRREWQDVNLIAWEIGFLSVLFLSLFLVFLVIKKVRDKSSKEELEVKADTDLLTGLYNKMATEKLIKNYIAQNPTSQCLFIILDLDNFKNINDTLGHAFGDEVLQYLGMRLSSQFRVTDIVGRVGGDEFMIFLKNMKTEDMEAEARKMSRFFNNFQVGEYTKFYATASMGAAVFPKDANTFEGLYRAADNALYEAKKNGKKQLVFFSKGN